MSTRPNSSTGSCHILRTRRSTKLACEHDADSDGVHLARAANIVRRDMMKMKTAFSGSFDALCQEQSVPNSLLALVAMIVNGPTIQEQSCHSSASTPTLTISQVLVFNSYARRRQSTSIENLRVYHARPQSGDPLACVHGNAGAHKDSQTRPG